MSRSRVAPGRLWKVGELAERTGLTVRTLHHYDAIGLLCPSRRTEGGARLYGRDDLILRVATLDEDPQRKPERQIWASHEVPWLTYGPSVIAYPEWEPGHR